MINPHSTTFEIFCLYSSFVVSLVVVVSLLHAFVMVQSSRTFILMYFCYDGIICVYSHLSQSLFCYFVRSSHEKFRYSRYSRRFSTLILSNFHFCQVIKIQTLSRKSLWSSLINTHILSYCNSEHEDCFQSNHSPTYLANQN